MEISPKRFVAAMLGVSLWVGTIGLHPVLLAQHSYTPAEVEEGGRLFKGNCAICHGDSGNQMPAAQLGSGKFRRANSDEEAVRLIRTGIPDAGMPAFATAVTEAQAGMVVAWLRSLKSGTGPATAAPTATADVSLQPGDASRGKAIVEGKGQCLQCHRINGVGARWAPELSTIAAGPRGGGARGGAGARGAAAGAGAPVPAQSLGPTPQQLQQWQRALLDPDAEVSDANRTFRAVTRSGVTHMGRLLNLDTFTVQLLDNTDRLVSLERSNLREFGVVPSPMPSYRGKLTPQEMSDVVGYLATLR